MTTDTNQLDRQFAAARLVDVNELADLIKMAPRTIWRCAARAAAGLEDFPRPITIGPRLRRWRLRDVLAYIDRREGAQNRT